MSCEYLNKNFCPSHIFGSYLIVALSYLKKNKFVSYGYKDVHPRPKVWFDSNLSTSRYNKILKKINRVKNILHNNNYEKLLTNP